MRPLCCRRVAADNGRPAALAEEYLQGLPGAGGGTPVREEVEGLANAAHRFAAASHAFWAAWGCIKAITEDCLDFDYLGYAQGRLVLYRKWKADIV